MSDTKAQILTLEVDLLLMEKRMKEAIPEAFIDGYGICYDEEEAEDAWLKSDTFRKLTTGE